MNKKLKKKLLRSGVFYQGRRVTRNTTFLGRFESKLIVMMHLRMPA